MPETIANMSIRDTPSPAGTIGGQGLTMSEGLGWAKVHRGPGPTLVMLTDGPRISSASRRAAQHPANAARYFTLLEVPLAFCSASILSFAFDSIYERCHFSGQ